MVKEAAVPIPKRMQHLPRDPRGYPIPVIVFRDRDGRPHFTINDEGVRFRLIMDDCCSICGGKLLPERWFVGGPGSAFHPDGAYIDGPMHRDCARYALRVCPYLAAPSYGGRIDSKTVRDPAPHQIFVNPTVDGQRPDFFVAVGAVGHVIDIRGRGPLDPIYLKPKRPYRRVEFWQHGRELPAPKDYREVEAAVRRLSQSAADRRPA